MVLLLLLCDLAILSRIFTPVEVVKEELVHVLHGDLEVLQTVVLTELTLVFFLFLFLVQGLMIMVILGLQGLSLDMGLLGLAKLGFEHVNLWSNVLSFDFLVDVL